MCFENIGQPMYVESYDEGEQFEFAKERLTEVVLDDIALSHNLFADFMEEVYDSKDFMDYAKLLREFIAHKDDYFDKAEELREFLLSRMENFAEKIVIQKLTKR